MKVPRAGVRYALAAALVAGVLFMSLAGPHTPTVGRAEAQGATAVPMLYSSAPNALDSRLQAIVDDVVGDLGGTWGVVVKKLDTGQFASYNADRQHVSASLYKLWVLNELYRQARAGIVNLDAYVTIYGDDAYYDATLGDLRLPAGTSLTLRRAAYLMITVSDNTAAHLLVRHLGPDNINWFMRQNGLEDSYLDWSGVGDNLTTPLDVMRELELLATSQMVDAEASREMVGIMLDQQVNNLLAPGLSRGVPFAHKHGALGGLLHDAGIVYTPSGPFIIVAMASNLPSYSLAWDNMPELLSRVHAHFNQYPASPALYFPQTRQTVGHDFLKFWSTHGGLEIFGYPTDQEHMKGGILVQQFEKARFEWHPESATLPGAQPAVVLGLLGQERAAQMGLSWPRSPDAGEGRYFEQTGQAVSGEFYDFWANNGGERVFGLPISPQVDMPAADGNTYATQWFQRVRMELHPDLPPSERIVLANLGAETAPGQ